MTAKILVIDIETLPALVETFSLWDKPASHKKIVDPVRMVCFAAKWVGSDDIEFYSEWGDGRQDMIEAAWSLLDEAEFVVTWNGRKFDIPTLNFEFLLAELAPPSPYRQIDLYQVARSTFRAMSNRLDFYAQQIMGDTKLEAGGLELWQTLRRPESDEALVAAQRLMEDYNRQDVVLTADLFEVFRPWIRTLNVLGPEDADERVCPKCGSRELQKRGVYRATTYWYPRFYCKGCGGWSAGRRSMYSTDLRPV